MAAWMIAVGGVVQVVGRSDPGLGVIDAILGLIFVIASLRLRQRAKKALAEGRPCPAGWRNALAAMRDKRSPRM